MKKPPHLSVRGPDCSRQRLVTMLWGKTAKQVQGECRTDYAEDGY